MRPPFKYHGSKNEMLKYILPLIPPHNAYVEPFCGSAAVFFAKVPTKFEFLNDIKETVINFYRVARHEVLGVELQAMVNATLHSEAVHRRTKAIFKGEVEVCDVERAYAFWYQTNFSFAAQAGGGYSTSSKCSITEAHVLLNKVDRFKSQITRLRDAQVFERPALELLRSTVCNKPDTFAYIDPPYFNSDCGHYKGYTEQDFTDLLEFLTTEFRGKFLLSSYPSEVLTKYIEKYSLFFSEYDMPLKINAKNEEVQKRKCEVLTWNYKMKNDLFN